MLFNLVFLGTIHPSMSFSVVSVQCTLKACLAESMTVSHIAWLPPSNVNDVLLHFKSYAKLHWIAEKTNTRDFPFNIHGTKSRLFQSVFFFSPLFWAERMWVILRGTMSDLLDWLEEVGGAEGDSGWKEIQESGLVETLNRSPSLLHPVHQASVCMWESGVVDLENAKLTKLNITASQRAGFWRNKSRCVQAGNREA